MADHQYLSIGEVLGLLLEDFPDVTISKIRFLESQGLIEPERTPSGYRKFYDGDVELLRAILHEQKANFLPLKVIRDRIESGAIDADTTGGRTPPRGIRNVEQPPRQQPREAETRDSVFRRTDGGPEWAGGRALSPGEIEAALLGVGAPRGGSNAPITTAVPVIPGAPRASSPPAEGAVKSQATGTVVASMIEPLPRPDPARDPAVTLDLESGRTAESGSGSGSDSGSSSLSSAAPTLEPSEPAEAPHDENSAPEVPQQPLSTEAPVPSPTPKTTSTRSGDSDAARELPYNPDELCEAARITAAQLAELLDFGIISARGSGADTSFQPEAVEIARVAGQLLAQGIDARHLRAWRQAAERESALFEQRIMPLLRQRNPHARQLALDSLTELSGLGARLHDALVDSLLRHHFDGT